MFRCPAPSTMSIKPHAVSVTVVVDLTWLTCHWVPQQVYFMIRLVYDLWLVSERMGVMNSDYHSNARYQVWPCQNMFVVGIAYEPDHSPLSFLPSIFLHINCFLIYLFKLKRILSLFFSFSVCACKWNVFLPFIFLFIVLFLIFLLIYNFF